MALFGRKRRSEAEAPEEPVDLADDFDATDDVDDDTAPATRAARRTAEEPPGIDGPYDRADVPGPQNRVDLGSLWVAGIEGMKMQLDMTEEGTATKLTAFAAGSSLEISAFAAPRSAGIWSEIRDEIVTSVEGQGGSTELVDGPNGVELIARIPRRGPDGRTAYQPARFLGCDGPRWFLRGVLTGPAATEEAAAGPFRALYRSTVVLRGTEAMAPREVLPLRVPDERPQRQAPGEGRFGPLARGPEIAEIR